MRVYFLKKIKNKQLLKTELADYCNLQFFDGNLLCIDPSLEAGANQVEMYRDGFPSS
jgi:hypothetical protein